MAYSNDVYMTCIYTSLNGIINPNLNYGNNLITMLTLVTTELF